MIIFEPARIPDYEQIQSLILDIQTSEFSIDITLDDQPDLKDIESFTGKGLANSGWQDMAKLLLEPLL